MTERRRIAFVIPRYGEEVAGGAERHCREVARRLARDVDLTVLTTCALDYERWANHYCPGTSDIDGVRVERFPVTVERDPEQFAAFGERTIARQEHGTFDELQWLLLQGPCAPELVDAVRVRRDEFDLFVFWIYLFLPTYFGMPLVADKAVFVPLAHDEPPFHLELFRPLYHLPRWIVFNSAEERELIRWRFGKHIAPGDVVGAAAAAPLAGDARRFRRGHGIADPFVLYLGRVNPSKGCDELIELFSLYKRLRPSRLKLVLAGNVEMPLPLRADVVPLGYVDEQTKGDALAACALTVTASRFESFSMTALESWLARRAVLVNGAAAPLREHVRASGGGLWFDDEASFCASLDRLLGDDALRSRLADDGRRHAEAQYSWDGVHGGWLRAIEQALAR